MDSLKLFLRILTVVTVVGPLCLAFMVHRDDPMVLVTPRFTVGISAPDVRYIGFNVSSSNMLLIMFNFTNPYGATLNLNCFSGRVLCRDHKVFLGNFSLTEKPISLKPGMPITLTLLLNYSDEGKNHFRDYHREGKHVYVDLEFSMDVQGVILRGNYTHVGPIPLADE